MFSLLLLLLQIFFFFLHFSQDKHYFSPPHAQYMDINSTRRMRSMHWHESLVFDTHWHMQYGLKKHFWPTLPFKHVFMITFLSGGDPCWSPCDRTLPYWSFTLGWCVCVCVCMYNSSPHITHISHVTPRYTPHCSMSNLVASVVATDRAHDTTCEWSVTIYFCIAHVLSVEACHNTCSTITLITRYSCCLSVIQRPIFSCSWYRSCFLDTTTTLQSTHGHGIVLRRNWFTFCFSCFFFFISINCSLISTCNCVFYSRGNI